MAAVDASERGQMFAAACHLLGIGTDQVRLAGPTEWRATIGRGVPRRARGLASAKHRMIYVKRGATADVFVHELLHVLFPSRPHWWIYEATWSLTEAAPKGRWRYGGGQSTWAGRHKMEPPEKILELARRAAKRKGLA